MPIVNKKIKKPKTTKTKVKGAPDPLKKKKKKTKKIAIKGCKTC